MPSIRYLKKDDIIEEFLHMVEESKSFTLTDSQKNLLTMNLGQILSGILSIDDYQKKLINDIFNSPSEDTYSMFVAIMDLGLISDSHHKLYRQVGELRRVASQLAGAVQAIEGTKS